MTTARQITAALKGRWHGSYGMASCPSHLDGETPALKISDDPRKSDGSGVLEGWRPQNGPSYPKLKFADEKPDPQDNEHYETAKETPVTLFLFVENNKHRHPSRRRWAAPDLGVVIYLMPLGRLSEAHRRATGICGLTRSQ
jgi:hypothetical protein